MKNGADGRYFFLLKKGAIIHISKEREQKAKNLYELRTTQKDLLMATFRNWSVDLRKFSLQDQKKKLHGERLDINELREKEFILSQKGENALEELKEFLGMISQVKAISQEYQIPLYFGNRKGIQTVYEEKEELFLKLKLIPSRKNLLVQLKKRIYQLWVLSQLITVLDPEDVSEILLSRNYKGKQLDHPKRLFEAYKDEYGTPPKKISGLFGRKEQLTLGKPTTVIQSEDTFYSLWEEFQAPTPEPKTPRVRPDFLLTKGKHDSLFDSRILEYINDYELGQEELAPDFFECLRDINLLIECKTFEWKWEKVNTQIQKYNRLLHPQSFLIITRDTIPVKEKKILEEKDIQYLDAFRPEKQEEKIEELSEVITTWKNR